MLEPVVRDSVSASQELLHGAGHDYEHGSPHLAHRALRNEVLGRIRALVAERVAATGRCRVLEVGAGHGAFTDHVAAMGAELTVTEMSRPSLDVLAARFRGNDRVRLVFDPDGEAAFSDGARYDVVLAVSVLHHVPDYARFVDRLADVVDPGGSLATFQDPLYYPRRTRAGVRADRVMYLAWRVRHGELRRGVATQVRRLRGRLDDTNPSDLVEYHVVRDGVDEQAVVDLLEPRFAEVDLWRYFSTQSPALQRLGSALGLRSTFGVVATRRAAAPEDGAGPGSGPAAAG